MKGLYDTVFSRYYNDVNYLYGLFTLSKLPRFTKEQEQQLLQDFELLQKAFNELSGDECRDRTNLMKGNLIFKALLLKNGIKYEKECFQN